MEVATPQNPPLHDGIAVIMERDGGFRLEQRALSKTGLYRLKARSHPSKTKGNRTWASETKVFYSANEGGCDRFISKNIFSFDIVFRNGVSIHGRGNLVTS